MGEAAARLITGEAAALRIAGEAAGSKRVARIEAARWRHRKYMADGASVTADSARPHVSVFRLGRLRVDDRRIRTAARRHRAGGCHRVLLKESSAERSSAERSSGNEAARRRRRKDMANGASATADLAEETASSTRDEIAMLSMTREASGEDAGDATAEEGMVSVSGGSVARDFGSARNTRTRAPAN